MSMPSDNSLDVESHNSIEACNSRENCGPTLLAAIPFSAIAVLSLASPMLLSSTRLAATLSLVVAATGLAIRGWPRRTTVYVTRAGQVRTAGGRLVMQQPTHLSLKAVCDKFSRTSGYRFQLLATDDNGVTCILLSARDPEIVVDRAKQISDRLGLRVDVQLRTLGTRVAFESSPSDAQAAQTHALLGRLPQFPRYLLWLAWGSSLFVWVLAGSLLHAQWLRGGTFSMASLLLFAFLCGIGLLFPHWALGTRFWIEARAESSELAMPGSVIEPASNVTLWAQGIFGRRQLASWDGRPGAAWLLSPGAGGQWHLMLKQDRQLRSLRLATRPDPLDEVAPRVDLR